MALFAWAAGCNIRPELLPAPGYTSAIGRASLGVESRSGVMVTADASVWDGSPANLAAQVTPLWVTVRNTTGRPLRVQYDEFTLKGVSGAAYRALAPYLVRTPPPGPPFTIPNGGYFDRFKVAPYLAASYPWLPVWDGPLPRGPSERSVAVRPRLPTANMLDRALPEGVLETGGTASGYLYFQKVASREKKVSFLADLQEPPGAWQPGRRLALIDIPFQRSTRVRRANESIYAPRDRPEWGFP